MPEQAAAGPMIQMKFQGVGDSDNLPTAGLGAGHSSLEEVVGARSGGSNFWCLGVVFPNYRRPRLQNSRVNIGL